MSVRTLALAAALAAAAPAVAEVRTYTLAGFDRVALAGQHDARVSVGPRFSVRAEGRAADLDRLDLRVENGALELRDKRRAGMNWSRGEPVRFTVTMPRLVGVSLAGSGALTADRASGQVFAGEVAGSGQLRIGALDVREARFSIAGSGAATAGGRCGEGQYEIAGSGTLNAGGLRCDGISVEIAGSGDVVAFARRAAVVSIAGSGDVRVAGGARCTVSRMGSGKVTCPA